MEAQPTQGDVAGEAARREFGLGLAYDVQDQKHAGLFRRGA
jgi:hypothetical protein